MLLCMLQTLKGIVKDRTIQGIMGVFLLFLLVPTVSTLSMRQATELSTTLSLSLVSFIMLLLAVFLGSTSIWRDIERRYTYSVLSLPLSRSSYLIGKFAGIAFFLFGCSVVLGGVSLAVIKVSSGVTAVGKPFVWWYLLLAVLYDALKYILLVAVSMLFSSISTSFFLPIFGTISTFLAGTVTQEVYDYLNTPSGLKSVSPFVRESATLLYYILPNFSGFDLKVHAIYSITPDFRALVTVFFYFLAYTAMLLGVAAFLFERREMK
ncbi:ABC transporter permease subunit [Geobacter pelophilus]|uniref:ABC transporter permease subunit n=1 Tax=Geoanaerobacter pelophilus TaxID=60036 RepID=A0AAW4L9M9_9BACT|nr:ABC transporter permease subunit [Geoanaerobacter pelophilus]MBT0664552.1 ABC transporter permease subunit [Geoanaerobacter pelophilus]